MPEDDLPFAETIRAFHQAGIRFVVIGGVAMGAHGSSLLTADVDLTYADDTENTERIAALLHTIHARVLGQTAGSAAAAALQISAALLRRVRFLNLATDFGAIDLMREVPGIEAFEGLWERAAEMDLGGFVVRVAALDDLIAMKQATGRPKDRVHLYELQALRALLVAHAETAAGREEEEGTGEDGSQ